MAGLRVVRLAGLFIVQVTQVYRRGVSGLALRRVWPRVKLVSWTAGGRIGSSSASCGKFLAG